MSDALCSVNQKQKAMFFAHFTDAFYVLRSTCYIACVINYDQICIRLYMFLNFNWCYFSAFVRFDYGVSYVVCVFESFECSHYAIVFINGCYNMSAFFCTAKYCCIKCHCASAGEYNIVWCCSKCFCK